MNYLLSLILFIFSANAWSIAIAEQWEDPEKIREIAYNFLENEAATYTQDYEISVKPLDARHHLKLCKGEMVPFFPSGRTVLNTTSIGVKCEDSAARWSVYLSTKIEIFTKALLTTRLIRKGEMLKRSDVLSKKVSTRLLKSGFYTDFSELVGREARKNINASTILNASNTQPITMVEKNDLVTIRAEGEGFIITAKGLALQSGMLDDVISVKNIKSGRTVQAIVKGPNQVHSFF